MRRKLSGQPLSKPPAPPAAPASSPPPRPTAAPPAAPPPSSAPPKLPAEGYEPEVEIAPGQFYSRRKPKFPLKK